MYAVAIPLAVAIGYIDTHARTDDNLPIVAILLVCAFIFGLAQPRNAWQWGVIFGLAVPAAHLIGLARGYHPPYLLQPNVLATFIAAIPAFIGAYGGALARNLMRARRD